MFSGGVFKKNKLKTGAIWEVTWSKKSKNDEERQQKMKKIKETVFLFKFLFPRQPKFPNQIQSQILKKFQAKDDNMKPPRAQNHRNGTRGYQTDRYSRNERRERQPEPDKLEFEISLPEEDSSQLDQTLISSPDLENSEVEEEEFYNYEDFSNRPKTVKKPLGLSLNLSKLHLKLEAVKITNQDNYAYEDIKKEEDQGFDYDIRDSVRKLVKFEHFKEKCSEVISNFLYIGSYFVASSKEILNKNKITHVLNCAGDYCKNQFLEDLTYKTYYLKDGKEEVSRF